MFSFILRNTLYKSINFRSGGAWLVTDMTRTRSIFELDDTVKAAIENGIFKEGSNLTGVNSTCVWSDRFIPRKFNEIILNEKYRIY